MPETIVGEGTKPLTKKEVLQKQIALVDAQITSVTAQQTSMQAQKDLVVAREAETTQRAELQVDELNKKKAFLQAELGKIKE